MDFTQFLLILNTILITSIGFFISNKSKDISKSYEACLSLRNEIKQQKNEIKLLKAKRQEINDDIKTLQQKREVALSKLPAKTAEKSKEAILLRNFIMNEVERSASLGSSQCTINFNKYLFKKGRSLFLDGELNDLFISQLRTVMKEFKRKNYRFDSSYSNALEEFYLHIYW